MNVKKAMTRVGVVAASAAMAGAGLTVMTPANAADASMPTDCHSNNGEGDYGTLLIASCKDGSGEYRAKAYCHHPQTDDAVTRYGPWAEPGFFSESSVRCPAGYPVTVSTIQLRP